MPGHAPPPVIPGLTFVEAIGAGGFADVFLYQQQLPARKVAVKVLREGGNDAGLAQFYDEANVMAQLSGHPAIVPIFQADVSQDGRPYLVMEYCPPPHLAQRYRTERIGVPEVLEIGIRISSAVETAHRAGILHRDIKPHNILTSAYGAPLLTDFGIASAAADSLGQSQGMSVPWSPPEVFLEPAPLDVRSDVFSLAATVYSLLAGRSPFEVPGGVNDMATLIHRIENQQPTRVVRSDVPEALNDYLLTALAKSMDARPPSAMSFARGLQDIQASLHLTPTRLEVMDASAEAGTQASPVEDERTRVRPVAIIVPDQIAERGTRLRPRTLTQADDRTSYRARPLAAPDTVQRRPDQPVRPDGDVAPLTPPPVEAAEVPARRVSVTTLVGAGVLVVIAVLVVVGLLLGDDDAGDAVAAGPDTTEPTLNLGGGPASPASARLARVDGELYLTWKNPQPSPDDLYVVRTGPRLQRLGPVVRTGEERVPVTGRPGSQVCYWIVTSRNGATSRELQDCGVAP